MEKDVLLLDPFGFINGILFLGSVFHYACHLIAMVDRTQWDGVLLYCNTPRCRFIGLLFAFISYLVDPASSHMLVSKTKPCMSKYKRIYGETANGSLNRSLFIGSFILLG